MQKNTYLPCCHKLPYNQGGKVCLRFLDITNNKALPSTGVMDQDQDTYMPMLNTSQQELYMPMTRRPAPSPMPTPDSLREPLDVLRLDTEVPGPHHHGHHYPSTDQTDYMSMAGPPIPSPATTRRPPPPPPRESSAGNWIYKRCLYLEYFLKRELQLTPYHSV